MVFPPNLCRAKTKFVQPKVKKFYNNRITGILTSQNVMVDVQNGFNCRFLDVFQKYNLQFNGADEEKVYRLFRKRSDMSFWQNQLNCAVWCATTGCGISVNMHLLKFDTEPLIYSVIVFHIYFQLRSILTQMKCPLPTDAAHNAKHNLIDLSEYNKICNEFHISPDTDWRTDLDGYILENNNVTAHEPAIYTDDYDQFVYKPGKLSPGKQPYKFSLVEPSGWHVGSMYKITHIDTILQVGTENWQNWLVDVTDGFTEPGIERLNESIRAYVYCVLGAQV